MKHKNVLIVALAVAAGVLSAAVYAQATHPYHNGSVWDIATIRVKPGMDEAYMNYLCGQWKAMQEASKKEGLIISYKVLTTESHGTNDWNLLLMTEYKDMASMESSEEKSEALESKIVGDEKKQMEGYKDRESIREIIGNRLAREMVLEPKK